MVFFLSFVTHNFLQMELESYDYEPYDYGLEEEDFYENNPPTKQSSNVRRVTFNKRVFAKVNIYSFLATFFRNYVPKHFNTPVANAST